MLRRKLLMIIAPMVVLLLIGAATGIWVLEETLGQMQETNQNDLVTEEKAHEMVDTIRDVRKDVHEMIARDPVQPQVMSAQVDVVAALLEEIRANSPMQGEAMQRTLGEIAARMPALREMVSGLANSAQAPAREKLDAALATCNDIDVYGSQLDQGVRDQARAEQEQLSRQFRLRLAILAVASLVIINLSILALLRMGSMILRPVDRLVEAARLLGQEHFQTRVRIDGDDEFGVLASAYNHMAEQLQASEQRRVEVLGQVALTMNHELNNIINIIELQVSLLSRGDGAQGEKRAHLEQIRSSLARMTGVMDSLKHARRIVLTDYMTGMKMLDLERSTQEADVH
jgi:methyl-accepting chemotaxis protein